MSTLIALVCFCHHTLLVCETRMRHGRSATIAIILYAAAIQYAAADSRTKIVSASAGGGSGAGNAAALARGGGGGDAARLRPVSKVSDALATGTGAALGIAALSLVNAHVLPRLPGHMTAMGPPLGALAVILYVAQHVPCTSTAVTKRRIRERLFSRM